MAYCPNCGVELAKDALSCPLCGAGLQAHEEEKPHFAEIIIDPADKEKLSVAERRMILWEMRSVSLAIAAIAVLSIDLVLERRLSWSLYPLFSLAYLWIVSSAARFFHRGAVPVASTAAIGLPILCIGFNWIQGGTAWSVTIALPVILVFEAGAALWTWAFFTVKRRGLNLVAFGLAFAAGICMAIEVTLDLAASRPVVLQWSAIVGFCLLPVAAFLLYIHYRAGRKSSFRRIFRI